MKKILLSLLGLLIFSLIIFYDSVAYVSKMGYNQIKIVYDARPIDEILADPSSPDSLKNRLNFVQEIKQYAFDSLGLNPSENYTSLYDQHGKAILWNLSACKEFEFVAKRWTFPIIGSFPYKGYFDIDDAIAYGKQLKADGWDVRVRSVGGWSTLGWFKDPILSNMLDRSDGDLANLIIHELTHSTLFIKDNIEFNENLASFVADQGAIRFLKSRYGETDSLFLDYTSKESDTKKFIDHILQTANNLDSLYQSFNAQNLTDTVKRELKQSVINSFINGIDTISFFNKNRFKISESFKPNNAYFMAFRRYNEKQNEFKIEFKRDFNFDFKRYLAYLK
ncbi:MAG: aminopeptidase, partial [Calditrichaeota bacterium]|nr:aminopeptidase [Calditrichota bacterium]